MHFNDQIVPKWIALHHTICTGVAHKTTISPCHYLLIGRIFAIRCILCIFRINATYNLMFLNEAQKRTDTQNSTNKINRFSHLIFINMTQKCSTADTHTQRPFCLPNCSNCMRSPNETSKIDNGIENLSLIRSARPDYNITV